MTPRNYLSVLAIVGFLFGVSFVVAPGPVLGLYGVASTGPLAAVTQLWGATLIGLSALNWMARNLQARDDGLRAVLVGNLVADGLAFLLALITQVTGRAGTNGLLWTTVVLYLLFALGAAYFLFMPAARPVASARR
jgi:hypothetical protein